METTNTITTYFGKGEYAITSKNISKLTKAVRDFSETGKWKWCLVDCLGIKADGSKAKRFDEVITEISTKEGCEELYIAMTDYVVPSVEITRTFKTSSNSSEKNIQELERLASTLPATVVLDTLFGDEAQSVYAHIA